MIEDDDRFCGMASVILTQVDDAEHAWSSRAIFDRVKEWSSDDKGFENATIEEVGLVIRKLCEWKLLKQGVLHFNEDQGQTLLQQDVDYYAKTAFGSRVAKIVASVIDTGW